MILTCPECATSYFVDDARVPTAGRLVKCTSCGARWTAVPDGSRDPEPEAVAVPLPKASEAFVPTAVDDLEVTATSPDAVAAARAPRAAPRREARGKVIIWAAAAVIVAGLVTSAIVFRGQVVRLWPASEAAYAGLGLPVNALGLVIEHVAAKPVFQGGRPVLAVTGLIRSVRDTPASAPPLRISLLDRAGKPVAVKIATPLDAAVPGHATRHFAIAIVDPPAAVHDLEVTFEAPARPAAAKHPAPGPHAAAAAPSAAPHVAEATPDPVEAKPLPPGSQDALPHHE